MNPIHHIMYLFFREKKKCPKCKSIQMIEKKRKNKKVLCKKCGAVLLPQ